MRPASLPLSARVACALGAYVVYGIAAALMAPIAVAYTQAHGITSFYELAPDEAPGPLGDVDRVLFDVKIDYALFVLTVTPIFVWLRGPWWLYFILLFFNELLLFGGYLFFQRLSGH